MIAFLLIGGIGFFMLVLTWFLGELFDLGHNLADVVVPDAVGDLSAGLGTHGAGAEHGPSPLSSRVIFTFMTAFGGGGAIASLYGLSTIASVGAGLAAGLVIGGAIYALSVAMFRQQSSSGFDLGSLIGRPGRVVVAIPAQGTGQVAIEAGGGTSTLLARAGDGSAVPQDRSVRVVRVEGNVLVVETLPASVADSA